MPERYATLTEVKAALDAGELPDGATIVLDNDHATMWDPRADCAWVVLWRGDGPCAAVEQALDALGLKWEDA